MTNGELIQELRDKAAVEGAGSTRRLLELAARALEQRLKEQEPVEPKISNTAIPVSKTAVRFVETYWCGSCGEAINQSDVYCRKCGQAVKWDD